MHNLIYLASPYTHPDENVREYRFYEVSRVAGELFKKGIHTFCPIAQSHAMAEASGLTSTLWKDWKALDINVLRRCDELWITTLDGWDQSVGVRSELLIACELQMPVKLISTSLIVVDMSVPAIELIIGPLSDIDHNDLDAIRRGGQ